MSFASTYDVARNTMTPIKIITMPLKIVMAIDPLCSRFCMNCIIAYLC